MTEDEKIWNRLIDLGLCREWKGKIEPTKAGRMFSKLVERIRISDKDREILFQIFKELRRKK